MVHQKRKERKKKFYDLWHFFMYLILGELIIFQEMEEVLAEALTAVL